MPMMRWMWRFPVLATTLALVPAAAAGTQTNLPMPGLLRVASALTGLPAPKSRVTVAAVPARTLRTRALRNLDRGYPVALQVYDEQLYRALGLLGPTQALRPALVRAFAAPARLVYEPATRRVSVPSGPAARSRAVEGLVRLLQDSAYGITRRTAALREDGDASRAAGAAADGAASLAVRGLKTTPAARAPARTRIDAFLALEAGFPDAVGTRLAANLYNVGGSDAVRSLLRRLPVSSEQVFHLDKYLTRERPSPIELPGAAGGFRLVRDDTFGELDVRALLAVFAVPRLARVGDGWGGGLSALYRDGSGADAVALRLDWDSERDAQEWQAAVATYVDEAFDADVPGPAATVPCAADACWSSAGRAIGFVRRGSQTALVIGTTVPTAAALASELVPAP